MSQPPRYRRRIRRLPLCLAFLLFLPCGILAREAFPDLPARVSEVMGTAAFLHEEEVDWSRVAVNLPVREGDRFVLLEDSHMEVELNERSFLRLSSGSDVAFHKLGQEEVHIGLNLGGVIFRINSSIAYDVSTNFVRIVLSGPGLYRLDVDPNGQTRIVVRKGSSKVSSRAGSRTLYEGEVLTILEGDDSLNKVALSYLNDDFDLWSDRRDARQVAVQAARYLGGSYAGVSDLDRYGEWGYLSVYGHIWWPRAARGWCPYRDGRWMNDPGWGWTWISNEPWGWLPYHYGAWTYVPYYSRWCWVPGYLTQWSSATVHFYSGQGYVARSPRDPRESRTKGQMRGRNNHWSTGRISFSTRRRFPAPEGLTLLRETDFLEGRQTQYLSPEPGVMDSLKPNLSGGIGRLIPEKLGVPGNSRSGLRRAPNIRHRTYESEYLTGEPKAGVRELGRSGSGDSSFRRGHRSILFTDSRSREVRSRPSAKSRSKGSLFRSHSFSVLRRR